MSHNKYSLYGYFGFENIGDDIMLLNALNYFDQFHKNSKFYVFVKEDYYSTNPDYCNYNNIEVFFIRLSPFINRILVYYYAFIVESAFWIGGTCLYETSSSGLAGMNWLMRLIKKYRKFNKGFSFCNIGIGDFTSEKGKSLFRDIVSLSINISCRDQVSLSKAVDHFKDSKKFIKGGDLACLFDYKRENKPKDNTVIFCGHYQYHDDEEIVLFYSNVLNELGKFGFHILFVPMHQGTNSDSIFHSKIANNLKYDYDLISSYKPGSVFEQLENASFIISMRLHGVFLSDIIGVPNIGIAYHEKVSTYVINTNVLTSIRNKQVGENITKDEIFLVLRDYKKPDIFLNKEKLEAIKGMSIFSNQEIT